MEQWETFKGNKWKKSIDVANFIEMNYQEYIGDEMFLKGPSKKTSKLWKKCEGLIKKENVSNILDVETEIITGIDNLNPGYIDHKEEVIVGLQTDAPLKRAINLSSGTDQVKKILDRTGFRLNPDINDKYSEYVKTYTKAINEVYSDSIKKLINNHVMDGLPVNYDRGRIVGDYRRLALYGTDLLIQQKQQDIDKLSQNINTTTIRLIEELREQINALNELKRMAQRYEYDISKPAGNAKEAIQWIYFAYLGHIKQNSPISASLGRNMTFIDIYIERDLNNGTLTEEQAQELIDQLVIKLRLVRYLRTQEQENLVMGSPIVITESIGGMLDDQKSLVTKTSYRLLNSLNNMGVYSEPNIVVLWSNKLPENFKKYTSRIAIETNCIQFENDDLIRKIFGTDYAISESVSALMLGRQTQIYGSGINLPKTLLYALNGGRDELTGELIFDDIEKIEGEYLDYEIVIKLYDKVLKKIVSNYIDALNIAHEMHDKYHYESLPFAFHNTLISRVMTFGVSGLTHTVDSLAAIKYGKVRVKRDSNGLTKSFDIDVEYPTYGNNDIRADEIASKVLIKLYQTIKKNTLYRNSEHTISIISNGLSQIYGNNTGATPDGRRANVPFALDANSFKGSTNLLNNLSSVAKLPYKVCLDGIANPIFLEPAILGNEEVKSSNLSHILDGYFKQGGQHINLNIIEKEQLTEAYNNPAKYQNLIVGISGYLVDYTKLTKEQQNIVLSSTFYRQL